jgi:hypothetical protein
MYETLEKNGDGDLGTQAICKYYEWVKSVLFGNFGVGVNF